MDALPPTHQFQAQNQIQDSSAEHRVPQYGPFHDQSQGLSAASQPAQIPLPDPKKSPPSNDSPAVKASPAPTTGTPQGKERTRHSSACAPCARRKVKCDRDVKNPCSNCLKRDQGVQCVVKSKDRLSSARSDQNLGRDGHRDKRPKLFEQTFQSTFRSTPNNASGNGYPPAQDGDILNMSPPQARMTTDYGPPEYRPPRTERTSVSMVARKSSEDAQWEAIEEMLPPRKDLLKYIPAYRAGPHVMSPVTRNFETIESQVCILLEELGTPQIRQRFSGTNAETEITRLARTLAILASGSRVEDSDAQTQRTIAREYVGRSFRCLQMANYLIRPVAETVETLFILATELLNEYQPALSWTLMGTASRVASVFESSQYVDPTGGINFDRAATTALTLQDAVTSLILGRLTPYQLSQLASLTNDGPNVPLDMPAVLIDIYSTIPDQILASPPRWPASRSPRIYSETLQQFHQRLDSITHHFPRAQLSECKSIRDRYEHYNFRLHSSYVTATVQRAALPDRCLSRETQDTSAGRALEKTLLDLLRAFLDFSAISNLPVRTWYMVHFALDSALELCAVAQAPDGPFMSGVLPRLLNVLDGGGLQLLSKRHQEAVRVMGPICVEMRQVDGGSGGGGGGLRGPAEEVRQDFVTVRERLAWGDDYAGSALVLQGNFGL